MSDGPLWITEAEVEALVDPLALIAAVEQGFLAAEAGAIREPGSTRMDGLDGGDSYLTLYPAHAEGGFATAKILAGRPANAREGRPEIDALVTLVDPATGCIAAIFSGRALTALRTAAATAAVLRRLMRRTPARIALIGTGGQARAHGRMLAAAGLASDILVASPRGDAERAEAAAAAIRAVAGIAARAAPLSAAVAGGEAIICLSLAERPCRSGTSNRRLFWRASGPSIPTRMRSTPPSSPPLPASCPTIRRGFAANGPDRRCSTSTRCRSSRHPTCWRTAPSRRPRAAACSSRTAAPSRTMSRRP